MLTPLLSLISSQDVLRPSISSFTAKIIFIFVPSTFFPNLRALAVASFGVRHIAGPELIQQNAVSQKWDTAFFLREGKET